MILIQNSQLTYWTENNYKNAPEKIHTKDFSWPWDHVWLQVQAEHLQPLLSFITQNLSKTLLKSTPLCNSKVKLIPNWVLLKFVFKSREIQIFMQILQTCFAPSKIYWSFCSNLSFDLGLPIAFLSKGAFTLMAIVKVCPVIGILVDVCE